MAGKQKRDKNGRFASGSSGFASSRLAAFGKHLAGKAAVAAGAAGGLYVAGKLLGGGDGDARTPAADAPKPAAKAPEPATPAKSKSTAPHNRSISLGHGVRIKGAQVSTLEQAAQVAINNTRNHGFIAHSSDKLRTAKSLEKLALIERRAHPDGTPESAARKPHYVITRQGVDALVKSGLLTTKDRDKWERARGRESFGNNL
jgi:hypothetical protein